MVVNIKKIEGGELPEYKTEGSSGADCYARLDKEVIIQPGKSATIPLGFAVEIPVGYELQIRGRSGLASKSEIEGFFGTIDSDYRGEVCGILFNLSDKEFIVKNGDRIAQAILMPIIKAEWNAVDNLSETKRGKNGFGSTGVESGEIKMSYNHPVGKFYEPFNRIEDCEKYFGKTVLVDNKKLGKIIRIVYKDFYGKKTLYFEIELEGKMMKETICSTSAFQRITVDGHRFGKEIEYEV